MRQIKPLSRARTLALCSAFALAACSGAHDGDISPLPDGVLPYTKDYATYNLDRWKWWYVAVTLTDANGISVTRPTDMHGAYSFDTATLKAPFSVEVTSWSAPDPTFDSLRLDEPPGAMTGVGKVPAAYFGPLSTVLSSNRTGAGQLGA